jgi:hypothetical protein
MKYIIVAVLASIGLIGGVWNWVNYFKAQNQGASPQVKATRPAPRPEIAALEQQKNAPQPVATASAERKVTEPELNIDLPDTVGRDPFLTPEEIEKIATGQFVDQVAMPVDTLGLKLTALLQDNEKGDYIALINGKSFREGDMVGAEKVVQITDTFVVLEHGGNRRSLILGSPQKDTGVSIQIRQN